MTEPVIHTNKMVRVKYDPILSIEREEDINVNSVDYIQFNLLYSGAAEEGRLQWNADDGTLEVGMPGGNVTLQIGQEMLLRAKATEEITNGSAVIINPASGAQPQVRLTNNLEEVSACTIAVATESVSQNHFGYFTTFGFVRGINTSTLNEGQTVFLGSTDGALTTTMPSPPSLCIKIGTCLSQHATEGVILVNIQSKELIRDRQISKEPTGFAEPDLVIVTDNGDRTVTLTGTLNAYYQGIRNTTIVSGYTSPVHDNTTTKVYFLTYNGTDIAWRDLSIYPDFFSDVLITFAFYSNEGHWVYLRETHGLMAWQTHREFHQTIGTYKISGGGLNDYTLLSTTAADRRPLVESTIVKDEDNPTTLPALTTESYTQGYNTSTGVFTFNIDETDIILLSTNNPYYNTFTSPNWGQTLMPANSVATVWLFAVPMALGTNSQKYRFVWVQPQWITQAVGPAAGQMATARANELLRQPSELNITTLTGLVPESVIISRLTIQYTGGNWSIGEVTAVTGNKFSQVGSPSGNYLTAVTTDTTLTGTGTVDDPLGVVQTSIMGVVVHGATAATTRPSGYTVVTWIGSVEPTNAVTNDIWINSSTNAITVL